MSNIGSHSTWYALTVPHIWRSDDRESWYILIIQPTRCTNFSNLFLEWNSTCFGQFLCTSSGVFHCTHSNGICHTGLLTACERDQDVRNKLKHEILWKFVQPSCSMRMDRRTDTTKLRNIPKVPKNSWKYFCMTVIPDLLIVTKLRWSHDCALF